MSIPSSPDGPWDAAPRQPSSSSESADCQELDPDPGPFLPVDQSSLLGRRLLRLRACSRHHLGPVTRRKRELIAADKKDAKYWDKRRKNNEAAKRSREKRRLNDLMLESQLMALSEENNQMRAQLSSLQYYVNLSAETSKAAAASASTMSLSHSTQSLFQVGLCAYSSSSSPASILGLRQQEEASLPFEGTLSCFSSATGGDGGFHRSPHSSVLPGLCETSHSIFPLSYPRLLSAGAATERGRSAKADVDHRQVSSSDGSPTTDASSLLAFSIRPDFLHHASTFPPGLHPPQSWLMSNHYNSLLLPWRSSYLAPPVVYPGLPHFNGREGQAGV
ncbi:hypothetical protein LDENG_00016190 [Lucifuga dentata]|nr:hypothetical protein LDENG_00016190 [Lucifuga dentata]